MNRKLAKALKNEAIRQEENIELIASENYVSKDILKLQGSILTNKYAEGYPGKKYYGGCEFIDEIENMEIDYACKLFKCKFANVQPHSGSNANMAVYKALLEIGDTVLGMDLSNGGHLTHGHPMNFSGKEYNIVSYSVDKEPVASITFAVLGPNPFTLISFKNNSFSSKVLKPYKEFSVSLIKL